MKRSITFDRVSLCMMGLSKNYNVNYSSSVLKDRFTTAALLETKTKEDFLLFRNFQYLSVCLSVD